MYIWIGSSSFFRNKDSHKISDEFKINRNQLAALVRLKNPHRFIMGGIVNTRVVLFLIECSSFLQVTRPTNYKFSDEYAIWPYPITDKHVIVGCEHLQVHF